MPEIKEKIISALTQSSIHLKARTRKGEDPAVEHSSLIMPNSMGGGGDIWPYDAKFREKCQWSHNSYTALIKQISLFDTVIVMTNT